jgi:hypothetical protein
VNFKCQTIIIIQKEEEDGTVIPEVMQKQAEKVDLLEARKTEIDNNFFH